MKAALEQLGFGPCYHMFEVLKHPRHLSTWHDAAFDRPVNWVEFFEDYQASVDFPASLCYRELLAVFPDAKVIHTVRDPQRWYDSTHETIYQAGSLFPAWLQKLLKPAGRFVEMQEKLIWQNQFAGRFEDRQRAVEIFQEHTAEVKRSVPPEQLLIYEVKQGWEPLCAFLEVPVPDTPFPYVNDRAAMIRRLRVVRITLRLVPLAAAGLILWGLKSLLG